MLRQVLALLIFVAGLGCIFRGPTANSMLNAVLGSLLIVAAIFVPARRMRCPSCRKTFFVLKGSVTHCMQCGAELRPE